MGVRPVEQPNMLAQMGQMMQLRQAQQEYEGSAGVNELSRQGVKDPYAYLQHGKTGRAAFESILKGQKDLREGQKLEVDLGVTKIGAFRDQLMANVNDPTAAAKWLAAVNGDPLVGKVLSSVPLADQIAAIPTDPKGFADWKNRTALKAPDFVKHFVESADAQLSSRTSIANNSATNAQSDVNSRRTDTRVREALTPLSGEKTMPDGSKVATYMGYSPYGNTLDEATMPTVTVGPLTTINPNAPTNALAPNAPTNVNALTMPPAGAPTSPVARPATAAMPSAAAPSAAMPSAASPTSVVPGGANAPAAVRFGPKSTDQNLTEYQGKSTAFAIRAKQADEILNVIGQDGKVQPGLIKRSAEGVPFIGDSLGTALNWTQSETQQQIEQAQRNFLNAVLRQESGAAINPSEFDNGKKQYFPQPGDEPGVIEQKRLNRLAAIQGFEVSAGPGAKKTTPPSTEPKRVNSDSDFNSLPSGSIFIAPDGTTRRKP